LPNVPEDYVHRIGRTGRAGANGEAVALVSPDEAEYLRDIERLLKKAIPVVPTPVFKMTTPDPAPQARAPQGHRPQGAGGRREGPRRDHGGRREGGRQGSAQSRGGQGGGGAPRQRGGR
jgi:ATP-dependent RNA helicase RhlE